MFKNIKRIPYKFDILILTLIPVISIIEKFHIGILSYRHGINNLFSISPMFLIFVYEPLKIAVITLSIIRLCIVKHAKKLNKYLITTIISILMFIGSWILPFICLQPGAVSFLKGYEKWVSKNVDVKAIQTWLLSGEADKYMGNTYAGDLPDDLPDFVINFEPKYVYFKAEKSGKEKILIFEWGGVLGHWGIVVGSPTTKTKQKGRIEEPGSSNVEIRRPIIPGVYIYYDG